MGDQPASNLSMLFIATNLELLIQKVAQSQSSQRMDTNLTDTGSSTPTSEGIAQVSTTTTLVQQLTYATMITTDPEEPITTHPETQITIIQSPPLKQQRTHHLHNNNQEQNNNEFNI